MSTSVSKPGASPQPKSSLTETDAAAATAALELEVKLAAAAVLDEEEYLLRAGGQLPRLFRKDKQYEVLTP